MILIVYQPYVAEGTWYHMQKKLYANKLGLSCAKLRLA